MSPDPNRPLASPRGIDPKERDRIAKLVSSERTDDAVNLAKDIHAREKSSESESLLLDAYGARVSSLAERHLTRDAEALVAIVVERYPAARLRLPEWHARIAARSGNLGQLLEELNAPELTPDRGAAILAEIRHDLSDPGQLADCEQLALAHPLRASAQAVRAAFDAVTSGPVTPEQIALTEIPRSSPLAPWKMLVRAIDAFQRGDLALCERCVAAIDHDSPAARLGPALRTMMGRPQALSPAATELVNQVTGGRAALRSALERLETAFSKKNNATILEAIKAAADCCRETDPGLARVLLQRISIRSMLAGLPPAKVTAAAGGMSIKDSRFWHLIALATERERNDPRALMTACGMWAQFQKHAVAEGRFTGKSPASAAVFLHIVDILEHIDPHTREMTQRSFLRGFDGFASYYRGQPPEIAAAGAYDGKGTFVYPGATLAQACEADPCTANFQRWFRTVKTGARSRPAIGVAERWARDLPGDIPAWLNLMQLAEERNALKLAFKYMERAEQLDGLNAEVRRARLRLLIRIAVKHFRDKKFKLFAADLDQIDALPQAQQGDRPALFLAFRHILANARQDVTAAREYRRRAADLLGGEPAGQVLIMQVEAWCRSPHPGPDRCDVNAAFAAGFARVCALGEDVDAPFGFFTGTGEALTKVIASRSFTADAAHLAALGEVALRCGEPDVVHFTASQGLRLGAVHHGRFLFLRARNLPGWEFERVASCVAAATELARRNHDSGLLAAIAAWRERDGGFLPGPETARKIPDSAEIAELVRREAEAPRYSPPPTSFERDVCQCPECRARRGETGGPFDEDDDFDDEFGDDFDPPMPPGLENLPPELIEMIQELGPEKAAKMLLGMLDPGGKQRGRRPGQPRKRR